MGSLDIQIGGSHYKNLAYQPVQFSVDMCLNFIQGNIVKYVSRYEHKGGKQDLDKVLHYAQLGVSLNPTNFCPYDKIEDKVAEYVRVNHFKASLFSIIRSACYQNWLDITIGINQIYND